MSPEPVRLGSLVSGTGERLSLVLPAVSDPYVDSLVGGRGTAESLRTLELLVDDRDVVLDVGANIGEYSLALSRLAARCVAVEPLASNLRLLRTNIALNEAANCEVIAQAVVGSGQQGSMSMHGSSAYASLHTGVEGEAQLVPTVGVRSLLEQVQPTVLKVDIEGFEEHIAFGLCDFAVSTPRAVLCVEINLAPAFLEGSKRVLRALQATGLTMYSLYPELGPQRTPPLTEGLPRRLVSDVLICERELPPDFDVRPLMPEEDNVLWKGV